MYIPLTSHVRSKTLSLHKKLSLPPSLSFSSFLPFFLPSSFLFFLSSFSRENIVYTPLSTYYREQEVNSEKKSDHSRLKLLPAVHTDPSVSFLLPRFSFSSPSKDDEARPGAAPYFFTFHTSHPLWEVRKHGTASPGFFFPISNSLPPSLSLSLVSSKIIPYCTTSDVSVLRKKERIT